MKKIIMRASLLALSASLSLSAAQTPGTNYWAASADTVNSTNHSGIVVTDSTYAACVEQFEAAMTSHAYWHGDVFTNIHGCHYVSVGSAGGVNQIYQELSIVNGSTTPLPTDVQIALEEKFIKKMSTLEVEYQISEFIKKRDALVDQHNKIVNKEKKNYK